MHETRVVILAAGKGKRMGADVPKPLVPIAGRPMIAHLLDSVIASGVDTHPVVVVAPDCVEMFRKALDNLCDFATQEEQLGTGHAVMVAKDVVGDAKRVVILYGDHPFISASTLRELVALHDKRPDAVAMLTSTVPSYDGQYDAFRGWARIIRDEAGEVIAIREAKDCSDNERTVREVNPGIYAFPASWMWERLPGLGNANASGEYYLTELFTMAFAEGMGIVTATADPLDVMGINTPEELTRAEHVFSLRQKSK